MTQAKFALSELIEQAPDGDVLRQMIQFVAQRLMDADVENLCGAGYDVKNPAARTNSRNGYRPRQWDTRAGSVELQTPKLRAGSYFPQFLEPRRTAERALAAVIQEAYVQGGLDPIGRRAGQGDGDGGHQQASGLAPGSRDRRAGRRLP